MSVVANVAINVDSRNAVTKLRQVQTQSQATERAVNGLGAAVGKLAAAFAAVQAVKFVFVQAAEVESQRRSLEVLTGSAQKAGQIIKELQQLGAVTPFTSTELIDSAKRLQAFGVEANKVVDTTRRLADVSGATGAELNGLVTAYGQVQAKGRLQGEELLQFQERGVALQKVLRDEYNLSGEEFQKALEKGQISAEAVEYAIQKLTDAGGKYANGAIAQSDTLNGKLSTLQDSFQRLAQNIGLFFEPVFKFLIDGINAFLERVNNAQRLGVEARAYQEANVRTRNKFGGLRYANPFDQEVRQYQERVRKSLVQSGMGAGRGVAPSAPTAGAPPPLTAPRVGGGGRAAGGGADKAANEAKRLADELQRSVERGDDLFRQFSRQAVLLGVTSETERKRLQIQYDYQDRVREINELKDAEQKVNLMAVNDEIKRLQTLELQNEELKKQIELFYELAGLQMGGMLPGGAGAFRTDINLDPNDRTQQKIDEYKTKLAELQDPINMAQRGAEGIGAAFSSSFQGIITGTQSTQEALASFFQNVAKSFIDMATEIIAQMVIMYAFKQLLGLFGGGAGIAPSNNYSGAFSGTAGSFNPGSFGMNLLPGRAKGGPVSSGQTYMVGERGPELFVPGRSGTIVANDKMGGGSTNVIVNVDAKGSSVEGNEQGANQLGRVISAAVQSELIKQQRPGGLLAR